MAVCLGHEGRCLVIETGPEDTDVKAHDRVSVTKCLEYELLPSRPDLGMPHYGHYRLADWPPNWRHVGRIRQRAFADDGLVHCRSRSPRAGCHAFRHLPHGLRNRRGRRRRPARRRGAGRQRGPCGPGRDHGCPIHRSRVRGRCEQQRVPPRTRCTRAAPRPTRGHMSGPSSFPSTRSESRSSNTPPA